MPITSAQVSVTTTATALATGYGTAVKPTQVHIRLTAATATYIGTSAVTSGTGWQVVQSTEQIVTLYAGDVLYAIATSGTVPVSVLSIW